jgi:hypothetical protein
VSTILAVRKLPDGRIQARRSDGKPMSAADRQEARRLAGIAENGNTAPVVDSIINDRTIAVLIDSTVLGSSIWFALRDDWRPPPGDPTPVFYASELPALRQKTPEQLRSIFDVRGTFGGGMVRQ